MRPNDGKHIAKGKGVHREVESEGSRWQKSDLTDINNMFNNSKVEGND